MNGGPGDNVIDLSGINPINLPNTAEMPVIDAGLGGDIVTGSGFGDIIDGGPGEDEICGGEGVDVINSGLDKDVVHGDEGDEEIDGGPSDDIVNGGAGDDILIAIPGNVDILSDTDGDDTLGFSEAASGIHST